LENTTPPAVLRELVAASEDEVEEFQAGEISWRLTRDGVIEHSPLGRALAARGLLRSGDLSWIVLSAYRRRGRGQALDLEALVTETRARRQRVEREVADKDARQRRSGIRIHRDPIVIVDHIVFDAGAVAIRTDGAAVLDAIGSLLQGNPQLRLLEIQGHAARGESAPVGLAERRVDAVRDYLVGRGVAPARLVTMSADTKTARPPSSSPDAHAGYVEFAVVRRGRAVGYDHR